ncbi:ceramidase [Podospora conica]|nr:ceramidase [Schizothecium conicum]
MSFMISHQTAEFGRDVHAAAGAWGPSTSRANFCEEDYGITFYIAEFINSLTNLAYIYYGLRHMYPSRGPRRSLLRPDIDFMSSSMVILGVGSFLFHASLRHTLEFVDELSMLVLTWSMLRATYTAGQPPATARAMSVALALFYVPYSALYVLTGDIILQVVAFVGAIALIGFRTHYLFGALRSTSASVNERRAWRGRTLSAVAVALLGYALWNIDLQFCPELRAIRRELGLPFAWLFEFHGWWHIFTAMGAGLYMDVVREMRAVIEQEKKR